MHAVLQWLLRAAIHAGYYPSLWVSRLMTAIGRWNWWDEADDHVLFGAVPSRRDLVRLRELGVGAIVNMCEEFGGHAAALTDLGIEQLRLPTLDYFAPAESDI